MDAERIDAEEWNELQRNLEMSIPAYDRINRFATLGQVSKWRRMVQDRLPASGRILEVGCGPGSFAEEVVGRDLVCLDPIPEMLRSAESRVNPKRAARGDSAVEFVEATAEDLPFDDNSFDAVCSLFSFRDWYDKRAGWENRNRRPSKDQLAPRSTRLALDENLGRNLRQTRLQ